MSSFSFVLCLFQMAFAEPDMVHMADIKVEISDIREEIKALKGRISELAHGLESANQRLEKFVADVDFRLSSGAAPGGAAASTSAASPSSSQEEAKATDGKQVYDQALKLLEEGDYTAARKAFKDFIQKHPKDKLIPNAHYWLGLSFFVEAQYKQAAVEFAALYQKYPKAEKTPNGLLKLAQSLAQIGQKSEACETLGVLETDYPKRSKDITKSLQEEKKKLKCKARDN